jgi:hypothetical protein
MARLRFNELHLVTDRCPRIFNGGVQLVDVDETCSGCKKMKEIDWEHRLIACCTQGKIVTSLEDFVKRS